MAKEQDIERIPYGLAVHDEEEEKLNALLYTDPVVTGDEPALQQHILLGCYFAI